MSLDKRYDFKKVEEGKYENWKSKGYFEAGDKSKNKFSMVIPPPNVTGKLHIGHSIDTTIQDITCRYKKAKGFDVLYLPGCDHAGIATQAKVDAKLKEQGISRFDIGREAFLKEAYKWKDEYHALIHKQWAKMGLMLDYSRERFTLDEGFQHAVYLVFKKLYDSGLIYRGERIVNYDPQMRTALSNVEVIYKKDKGYFYYFKYRFVDNPATYLTVATTRPETMFGDTCLVVNPNDDRYRDIIGKMVINPANNEKIPVIADEYVDIEFGTGVMKCTPAHDPNDYLLGKKYNMKNILVMNVDGTMNENAGKYKGLTREKCRDTLVNDIKNDDNLIKIEEIIHDVGHSERSDAVVEPILSKQWFIKMKPLAQSVLENQKTNNKVNFFPKRFEKTLINWMEKCDDWCISRQLWWGHRIPVYYNKTTNKLLISEKIPDNSGDWVQDEDVLDTWFSSALWPFVTLGWPNNTDDLERYYPLDCLITGYDIIFFWVARMYFQGLHFTNSRPFKDVVIHGLIRDKLGRKMSKTLGNGVDPIDVINNYGVDSLRYFLATTASPGLDMRYDEEKVKSASNYLNKIWNSARFILIKYEESNISELKIDFNKLNLIDKYILSKLEETIQLVTKKMDCYEYGVASNILYNFVYDDFCSFYIEMSKVSLSSPDSLKNTLSVLMYVLKAIIMMIYPFSPFISEEIYLNLPEHKDSIMLEDYPEFNSEYVFEDSINKVELLRKSIDFIRSYKVENNLAPNTKIDLIINGDDFDKSLVSYLSRFAFANKIEFNKQSSSLIFLAENDFVLYIENNLNKDAIFETLNKQKEFLLSEIERSKKILSNETFLKKAPEQKVNLEKEKYEKYTKELSLLEEKINKLK